MSSSANNGTYEQGQWSDHRGTQVYDTSNLTASESDPMSSASSFSEEHSAVPSGSSTTSSPRQSAKRAQRGDGNRSTSTTSFLDVRPDRSGWASTPSLGSSRSPNTSISHRRANSRAVSSTSVVSFRKPYPSTRLKGEVPKPWMKYPDPAIRWGKIIYWALAMGGVAVGVAICYLGYASIPRVGKLCLVMDDDFSRGIDDKFWSHEVRVDGFGNNEFEWTTANSNNSYVKDDVLYIVPTLTADVLGNDAIMNGYTLNLTIDGTCTSTNVSQCAVVSNSSSGQIINPIQSARLNTKGKASIKFGKVEVTAKMPRGDWMWPAIWMMPENSTYGEWPKSGEIDIAEGRGNGQDYEFFGLNWIRSTLHWGPTVALDTWHWTTSQRQNKVDGYHSKYHTFTLEWNEEFLTTYVDSRVYTVLDLKFNENFWTRGKFPAYQTNGTEIVKLDDPWVTADKAAPFDQSFYLILNVAVGGTNGYFPDNLGNKPWQDGGLTPMSDFWKAKDKWYPSWPKSPEERGMAVKRVKMWQKC